LYFVRVLFAEAPHMKHANYYEVEGSDPAEVGRALGLRFGDRIRGYIADLEDVDVSAWRRARMLLQQTEKYFPEYVVELQAYADAAGVKLLDLWAVAIEDQLAPDGSERCTTIVTNDGRLTGHNEDWDPDAETEICILKKRTGRTTSLELYYYGCPLGGVALSISSQGHVQCVNSIAHTDNRDGVPKHVIARALSDLRFGAADLEKTLAAPRSSGFAHILIDRNAQITSIECTATQHRVNRPAMPFVHTNHLLDPVLGRFGLAASDSSFHRFEGAAAMASPTMDLTAMTRLLGDQSRGKSKSILNRNTIARAIVDFGEQTAYFWLKQESEKGWLPYSIDFLFKPQP
jgi:hypothetical protein